MSAREMFETLGYECRKSENAIQYLSECGKEITFIFELHRFYKQRNFISLNIDIDEFKAIHQQMKELGWLEEEKQEIKKETNYEHYKDGIIELCIDELAISKGKVVECCAIPCSECDFEDKNGHCIGNHEIMKWLKQPYKKPPYKLSKFEFDIIQTYRDCHESCKFSEFKQLIELKGKGYFKGIDLYLKIHEILANCEVVRYISLQDFL